VLYQKRILNNQIGFKMMRKMKKKTIMMNLLNLIKKKKLEQRYYCLKVLMKEDLKPVSSHIPNAARKLEMTQE